MHQRAEKEEGIRQQTAEVRPIHEQTDKDENRNGHADEHHDSMPGIALFVIMAAHSKIRSFQFFVPKEL
jgi:hypothetical protein